jgi:hypothetical protein
MKHDKLIDVLHSTAAGLHQAGVMDLTTNPSTIQQW